jgi:hypothetical protein
MIEAYSGIDYIVNEIKPMRRCILICHDKQLSYTLVSYTSVRGSLNPQLPIGPWSRQPRLVMNCCTCHYSSNPSCYCRRPFMYQANNFRKSDISWEKQMTSAMTTNRFQYYSKLQTYASDGLTLVSIVENPRCWCISLCYFLQLQNV